MEIHPGVTPKPGEVVLTKKRTGPFTTTNLNEVLKNLGADTLILFGIATQGCVLTTVRCGPTWITNWWWYRIAAQTPRAKKCTVS
jgi:nicotinamidase-related amidase